MAKPISAETLRLLYRAEPFRPFDLVVDTGDRITVSRRNRLVISPTNRFVLVVGANDSVWQVNLKHVVEVQVRAARRRRDSGIEHRRRKAG